MTAQPGEPAKQDDDDSNGSDLLWPVTRYILAKEDMGTLTQVLLILLAQPIDFAIFVAVMVLGMLMMTFFPFYCCCGDAFEALCCAACCCFAICASAQSSSD